MGDGPERSTVIDLEPWHDLFVMTGGAGAALAGLIFVAVSLNLERILGHPSLPGVAWRTITILIGLVILSVFMLVPTHSRVAIGTEVLVLGLAIGALVMSGTVLGNRRLDQWGWKATNLLRSAIAVVPMPIGGLLLLIDAPGCFAWLVASVIAGIVIAAYQSWILLVEIRR